MGSNSFGQLFKITTWGESHGKSLGVVIDGCPAGLEISEEEINQELKKRQGGQTPYTTPRKEADLCEILSGVFEGQTTGAPISIMIKNTNKDSSKYEGIKDLYRPGHANFTYLQKYQIFDYRGGGRSSARETVCRVAAGAIAKKLLRHFDIEICAFIAELGGIKVQHADNRALHQLKECVSKSPISCPDSQAEKKMIEKIEQTKEEGDSLGAVINLLTTPMLIGLGDPVYEKLEANLAKAMMSIPATKGVEFGQGFAASSMYGSEHNDLFSLSDSNDISFASNNSGGILGGISNGMPLDLKVAFKPTSSIKKPVKTLNLKKEIQDFKLPEGSRHDPCVAIRAVPIVEAMTAICLIDALLINRNCRL